jgi:hypothetical protein
MGMQYPEIMPVSDKCALFIWDTRFDPISTNYKDRLSQLIHTPFASLTPVVVFMVDTARLPNVMSNLERFNLLLARDAKVNTSCSLLSLCPVLF